MGVCYVLSESFCERLVKEIDAGEARQIVEILEDRKQKATTGEEILERKTYRGTKRVRQIKIGQWRIASLYLRGIDIADVVQLCYIYNKNENREPDQDVLVEIDEAANRLFVEVADWSPDEESEYLETVQTQFPNL